MKQNNRFLFPNIFKGNRHRPRNQSVAIDSSNVKKIISSCNAHGEETVTKPLHLGWGKYIGHTWLNEVVKARRNDFSLQRSYFTFSINVVVSYFFKMNFIRDNNWTSTVLVIVSGMITHKRKKLSEMVEPAMEIRNYA